MRNHSTEEKRRPSDDEESGRTQANYDEPESDEEPRRAPGQPTLRKPEKRGDPEPESEERKRA